MTEQQTSKALNVSLWTAQVLLALFMLSGTVLKFMPIEKVSAMMPWTGQVPAWQVRALGLIDLLAGLGVILPSLLNIIPRLTRVTALSIILLMICAMAFHVSRGEASVIGANIFAVALAAFIAWRRK